MQIIKTLFIHTNNFIFKVSFKSFKEEGGQTKKKKIVEEVRILFKS